MYCALDDLGLFGLREQDPHTLQIEAVRRTIRRSIIQHHPDKGGNAAHFITLLRARYRILKTFGAQKGLLEEKEQQVEDDAISPHQLANDATGNMWASHRLRYRQCYGEALWTHIKLGNFAVIETPRSDPNYVCTGRCQMKTCCFDGHTLITCEQHKVAHVCRNLTCYCDSKFCPMAVIWAIQAWREEDRCDHGGETLPTGWKQLVKNQKKAIWICGASVHLCEFDVAGRGKCVNARNGGSYPCRVINQIEKEN